MALKKIRFRKAKPKPHTCNITLDIRPFERILGKLLFMAAEYSRGRVNISALFSDEAKEMAYESGFIGFNLQLPDLKPRKFCQPIPEPDREFILHKIYGEGKGPESLSSYQQRVQRHKLEYIPSQEVINDSPYAEYRRKNPTPLNELLVERLKEIRAKQTPETGSFPINETGSFLEIPTRTNPAPESEAEFVAGKFEGPDSRPDQG
jgi:hypothetical protein